MLGYGVQGEITFLSWKEEIKSSLTIYYFLEMAIWLLNLVV